MIELRGDLWQLPALARCITTNGVVNPDGSAVMGGGCALEAARLDPSLPVDLGLLLQANGNHVYVLRRRPTRPMLLSFPTKHHWRDPSDLALIERSAHELVAFFEAAAPMPDGAVLLPRPGCGLGGLSWDDVGPALAAILDDRFAAVSP